MARLIEDYTLEVYTPPCDPGTESFAAIAHFSADISEVLPLLNAGLTGAIYYPHATALTWRTGKLAVSFHASEISVANVDDRDDAAAELDELVELVNETWSRRNEITPDFESHQRPVPMDIYLLLPRTNCQECGEPTCFNFALKLVARQRVPDDCPGLLEPAFAESLSEIRASIPVQTGSGHVT
ncbi:MAG: (Fe-S)-binding protein [Anaerolineales bacterium]